MMVRDAMNKWKDKVQEMKRGDVLSALRSQKLKNHLEKVTQRMMRSAFNQTIPKTELAKSILSRIYRFYLETPKDALKIWRKYVEKCKEGNLLDALRAQKLKYHLSRIPIKSLKDTYGIITRDRRSV